MKAVAMIPARYESTRFHGKLMEKLGGKPVITHTYEAVVRTALFQDVIVVTNADVIYEEIRNRGGKVIKSRQEHSCGSNRIAEVASQIDVDIIVNVQGDEPFTKKEPLEKLLQVFDEEDAADIDVASLMQEMTVQRQIEDPNFVKVVVDKDMNALFFSRAPIPYARGEKAKSAFYEHIGVYAFRRNALIDFYHTAPTPLERAEKIECLRYLEKGKKIRMIFTAYMGIEIDTPEDLKQAEKLLQL